MNNEVALNPIVEELLNLRTVNSVQIETDGLYKVHLKNEEIKKDRDSLFEVNVFLKNKKIQTIFNEDEPSWSFNL